MFFGTLLAWIWFISKRLIFYSIEWVFNPSNFQVPIHKITPMATIRDGEYYVYTYIPNTRICTIRRWILALHTLHDTYSTQTQCNKRYFTRRKFTRRSSRPPIRYGVQIVFAVTTTFIRGYVPFSYDSRCGSSLGGIRASYITRWWVRDTARRIFRKSIASPRAINDLIYYNN